MQQQLAHPPRRQGRRPAAAVYRRRGLVSGGGQGGGQPGARFGGDDPRRGEALARCEEGQLVQPHRRGGARRGGLQRVVRAGE